jgi:hypothetical protein
MALSLRGYSANWARRGERDAQGRLEPDYDQPKHWNAPFWRARWERLVPQIADQVRATYGDPFADALFSAMLDPLDEDWFARQSYRELHRRWQAVQTYLHAQPATVLPDPAALRAVFTTLEPEEAQHGTQH